MSRIKGVLTEKQANALLAAISNVIIRYAKDKTVNLDTQREALRVFDSVYSKMLPSDRLFIGVIPPDGNWTIVPTIAQDYNTDPPEPLKPRYADEVKNEFGICCPKCGKEDKIQIVGTTWLDLTPDGTDASNADHEWDQDSRCWCHRCDYQDVVGGFTLPDRPGSEL